MTTWGSAYLLTKFNQAAQRPTGDTISDSDKYQRIADAQSVVIADIAARCPQSLYQKVAYSAMPTLTTADNQVFTFGSDVNGDALFPTGKVRIFPSLQAIPDYPWVEGGDYLNEGSQIRIPNNRTFAGPLYWRGIAPVLPITATNAPSLLPPPSRILIVNEAVRSFAEEGNRSSEMADRASQQYDHNMARWCLVWKTQFKSGGALGGITGREALMMGTNVNGRGW
jgi:hypothetical protein